MLSGGTQGQVLNTSTPGSQILRNSAKLMLRRRSREDTGHEPEYRHRGQATDFVRRNYRMARELRLARRWHVAIFDAAGRNPDFDRSRKIAMAIAWAFA